MNMGTLLLGVILLALVAAIPLFWTMVIGGVFFGAPFLPLIITIILALVGITFVVRGLTGTK